MSEAKSSAYNFCFNYKQTNYMHGPSLFLPILSVNHQVVYLIHHISQPFSTSNNPIGYVNNATHTQNNNNEWTNEWSGLTIYKNHSTNYLAAHVNRITICCFPSQQRRIYVSWSDSSRPAHHRMWLLENDQSPISRTGVWMQTPWGSQSPHKYMMPSQIHASVNSQFFLKHKCPLCITCVFADGKIFQNRRVSSPAPVTMVCKLHPVTLLFFFDIISG